MVKNIKWDKEKSKTARFSDLADPIIKAIKFAYKLERKNEDKDIKWTGYDIGERDKATCCSPNERLTRESLAFALEDQGSDALTEIITVAIQLGIEQGRRICRGESESQMGLIKYMVDHANQELKKL